MTYSLFPIEEPFDDFLKSVTPDFYDINRYIDWDKIYWQLNIYHPSISFLQGILDNRSLEIPDLEYGLENLLYFYEVIITLLSIPRGVGFLDGRELPDPSRNLLIDSKEISNLLVELGLLNLLRTKTNVQSLVLVALTAKDSLRRRYRIGSAINFNLESIVQDAIQQSNNEFGTNLQLLPDNLWPTQVRGKVEYIISKDNQPIIAIASVFQTTSGGRQQNDLSEKYPNLQKQLLDFGINLILIADGRGIKAAQPRTLQILFSSVASCLNFRQASSGFLKDEINRLANESSLTKIEDVVSVEKIIMSTLEGNNKVLAKNLPLAYDAARISLARFINNNPQLSLTISSEGSSISWKNIDVIQKSKELKQFFSPDLAIDCFSSLMNTQKINSWNNNPVYSLQLLNSPSYILPNKFIVSASEDQWDTEFIKLIASESLTKAPDSNISIFITPYSLNNSMSMTLRRLQQILASNVIIISTDKIIEIAQSSRSAQNILTELLLEQSDLVKANPFIVNSVTPERMFFGRENEESLLISKIQSNSIALLGGRRIGKTSLMRHTQSSLKTAGFITYFGDCQTVRNWDDFAIMAKRSWNIDVELPFQPNTLFDIINKLKQSSSSKIVIFLDEIDQLLDWDKNHTDDKVSEVLFKVFRTISQENLAQFIFSGERVISNRLWDAHSPHWNFCQPILLLQLDKAASRNLLINPLKNLQIEIINEPEFVDIAWQRTNGHPQLLQTLGDGLIRMLNDRPSLDRKNLSSDDLLDISNTFEYAQHYLETYWGQSTDLEKLLSLIIQKGTESIGDIYNFLHTSNITCTNSKLRSALRMLELYGIVTGSNTGYNSQLFWFSEAISFYGGSDRIISQYMEVLL